MSEGLSQWVPAEEKVHKFGESIRRRVEASRKIKKETGLSRPERRGAGITVAEISGSRATKKALVQEAEFELETEQLLGAEDSDTRKMADFMKENLKIALKQRRELYDQRKKILAEETQILRESGDNLIGVELESLGEIRAELAELDTKLTELKESTPEAFVGLHLKELIGYKRDMNRGTIVETSYVAEQAEDIAANLRAGIPVLIYGHLGTGKTEMAMHVAREYIMKDRPDIDQRIEKEFKKWLSEHSEAGNDEQEEKRKSIDENLRSAVVISGSKNMSLAEMYGHQVLALDKIQKTDLDSFVQEVEDKFIVWQTAHPDALEAEQNRAHDRLLQTYLTQLKSGTISGFFLGPVYQAMEEGRPVIIDEVNAIPHEILISLNHILTRRAGDTIRIQQDSGKEVTVRDGFCVMMTGNLNQGQDHYVDRQDMDPAFLSRLYKKEHDYLPQSITGTVENEAGKENELFRLLLAKVMDKNGNANLPENAVRQLWNLAKAARVTQDVFAGRSTDKAFYFQEGGTRSTQYFLQEGVLSLRALDLVIKKWTADGCKQELDYYVYQNFVSQSTVAADRAYLYQICKDQFDFFKTPGWEQSPDYGSGGVVNSFAVTPPKNKSAPAKFFGPRELVQFSFGKIPDRTAWPEAKPPGEDNKEDRLDEEFTRQLLELETAKTKIDVDFAKLEGRVAKVCARENK